MDVVILLGGSGTRLKPLTNTKNKPLLKIAGKTILQRTLENLFKLPKLNHFIFVVRKEDEQTIKYINDFMKDKDYEIVFQLPSKGTAKAVESVKGIVEEKFMVVSGDHILDWRIYEKLFNNFKQGNVVMFKKFENYFNYGVAIIENGKIKQFVEKPKTYISNLVNIGIYGFNSEIFDELKLIKPSPRGEYELTDILIGKNALITDLDWVDIAYPWNIYDAFKIIMKHEEKRIEGTIIDSELEGKVIVEKGAIIKRSEIVGPAYIGREARIGPFSLIEKSDIETNVEIGIGTSVKRSLVGSFTKAKHLTYIGDSIIGEHVNFGSGTQIANLRFDEKNVKYKGIDTGKRKFGVVIGDNVKIGINVSIMPGTVIENNTHVFPHTLLKNKEK